MFGLFKKKKKPDLAEVIKNKPYEPEKPVAELFEVAKENVKAFTYKDESGDDYYAIRFDFEGRKFSAFSVIVGFGERAIVMIDKEHDESEYNWLTVKERHWLFTSLSSHLNYLERARQEDKRQEFIRMLCK